MAGKFVLKKTGKGKFVFNLRASNGVTILTSEAYESKDGALNGIDSVRQNAVTDDCFERRTAKKGQPYFVLLAGNRQVIGQSEMYSSTASVSKGIASVKANAAVAKLEDLTVKS